ncbi:hypothetical protein WA158_001590 [Blastocystis sp. Blastoise]
MEIINSEVAWDPYVKEKKLGEHMKISDIHFQILKHKDDKGLIEEFLKLIKQYEMAAYYKTVYEECGLEFDQKFYDDMVDNNTKVLAEMEDKLSKAKETQGDDDILDLYIEKANLLFELGQKNECLAAYEESLEHKMSLNMKIDIYMRIMDLSLFHDDMELFKNIIKRDLSIAADLFMTCIPTFTSYSLFTFQTEIMYSIICCIISKSRADIKKYLIDSSDTTIVLTDIPIIKSLLYSFYECRYKDFFLALLDLEPILENDKYMSKHIHYIIRELRIQAYNQYLKSYKTCTMDSIAHIFGVSTQFIDQELSRFISAGRIQAKIDKIGNIIETKSKEYDSVYNDIFKKGDAMIERLQQSARNVNI